MHVDYDTTKHKYDRHTHNYRHKLAIHRQFILLIIVKVIGLQFFLDKILIISLTTIFKRV